MSCTIESNHYPSSASSSSRLTMPIVVSGAHTRSLPTDVAKWRAAAAVGVGRVDAGDSVRPAGSVTACKCFVTGLPYNSHSVLRTDCVGIIGCSYFIFRLGRIVHCGGGGDIGCLLLLLLLRCDRSFADPPRQSMAAARVRGPSGL